MTTTVVATTPVTSTDIEIIQGATFYMSVTWTDGAATPNPIPLSGYRAHMQIRRRAGAADPPLVDARSDGLSTATPSGIGLSEITMEPLSSDATPVPQTGVMLIRVPATVTATLSKPSVYDLFLIRQGDDTEATRILFGAVTISTSATTETYTDTAGDVWNG